MPHHLPRFAKFNVPVRNCFRDSNVVDKGGAAWPLVQTRKKSNHVSVHQRYLDCCDALGIPGVWEAVEQMIAVDYLIINEDWHQNKFGVIHNADMLEYLGKVPIYDSGMSPQFDKPTAMFGSGRVTCKLFKNSHEERITLVSSFDWLDLQVGRNRR